MTLQVWWIYWQQTVITFSLQTVNIIQILTGARSTLKNYTPKLCNVARKWPFENFFNEEMTVTSTFTFSSSFVVIWQLEGWISKHSNDMHFCMPALTTWTFFLTTCGTQFPSLNLSAPWKHSCSVRICIQCNRDNFIV